jgi:FKBP-type peptidyl-prolyl cis-trans isomerase
MRRLQTLIGLLLGLTIVAAGQAKMTTTKSGLKYMDEKVGTGEIAMKGDTVTVNYTGWLYTDGKRGAKFDSSLDRNQPFQFRLGARQVISGWDEGVEGMKVGGKRQLIIPPDLGYGARGFPGVIPPNSTLEFEVELLKAAK